MILSLQIKVNTLMNYRQFIVSTHKNYTCHVISLKKSEKIFPKIFSRGNEQSTMNFYLITIKFV